VPFGGRERELHALDEWLSDPAAPPYMVVAASAGQGKSALLVQWLRRCGTNVNAAFVPISVRARTNLARVAFAILAARLAKLLGRKLPYASSSEEWRGIVSGYLGEADPAHKPIVVIVDSLDEAADWQPGPDLFPLEPPTWLRVIVSARLLARDADARAWLERLGWTRPGLARSLELGPLDQAGIIDLLRDAGVLGRDQPPQEDGSAALVARLYDRTKGDPLLLSLYVKHLEPRGEASPVGPRDLPDLPPGLEGYMELWWDEQRQLWGENARHREPAVRSLLNLLAGALEPVNRDDLSALDPALDTWSMEDVISSVRRIVLGGKSQVFVYSHPRLGAFMFERLTAGEKQKIDQRFLRWGEEFLASLEAAGASVGPAPAYLSQQYSAHLVRAERHDALLALVGNRAWIKAQQAADRSLSSVFTDIGRAWRAMETVNEKSAEAGRPPAGLHREIRCALAAASMGSLSVNYPASALAILVTRGRLALGQALQIARRNPDAAERAHALANLAALFPTQGEQIGVLDEALESVRELESSAAYEALIQLVPGLMAPSLHAKASSIARTALEGEERAQVLVRLLRYLPDDEQAATVQEALSLIRDLAEFGYGFPIRAPALIRIIPQLPEGDRTAVVQEVLDLGSTRASAGLFGQSIAGLALFLVEPGKSEMLRAALAAVEKEADQQERSRTLQKLAPVLPEGLLDEALRLTAQLPWRALQANVFEALVPRLSAPLAVRAWKIAKKIEQSYARSQVLPLLARRLAETGMLEFASAEAQQVEGPAWERDGLLAALVPCLAKEVGAEKAIGVASAIETDSSRFEAWCGLVPLLPKPHWPRAIEEAIAALRSESLQTALIERAAWEPAVDLAASLCEAGLLKDALALMGALPPQNSYGQHVRLAALAKLLATARDDASRDVIAAAVLDAAEAINDLGEQALALAALGALVPGSDGENIRAAAVQTSHAIPSAEARMGFVRKIIPYLGEQEMRAVVSKTVADLGNRGAWSLQETSALIKALPPETADALIASQLAAPAKDDADEAGQYLLIRRVAAALLDDLCAKLVRRVKDIKRIPLRIKTLAALLPRIAPPEKVELLERILVDMRELAVVDESDSSPRAAALEAIAPHLEASVLDQAIVVLGSLEPESAGYLLGLAALAPQLARLGRGEEALDAVRAIIWPWNRERALAATIPHLSPALLRTARILSDEMKFPTRWGSVVALATRLADEEAGPLLAEALVVIAAPDAWTGSGDYREALPVVAPRLTAPVVNAAVTRVREVFADRVDVRAPAFAMLAGQLPEPRRSTLLAEAMALAEQIEDPDDRATALGAMSPYLPDAQLGRLFEVIRGVGESKYVRTCTRAEALAVVASRLARLPTGQLYPMFQRALHVLAARSRAQLLWDLWALSPVIKELGGVEAVSAVARDVMDAARRWP
jgi:hypothetical protein